MSLVEVPGMTTWDDIRALVTAQEQACTSAQVEARNLAVKNGQLVVVTQELEAERRRLELQLASVAAPTTQTVLSGTLDKLPVGPLTASGLRTALGDSTAPDNATMRSRIQVTDQGGYGRALSITLPANSLAGIVFFSKLPVAFDAGWVEFWLRFRDGFDWSMGGKVGFGLGGVTPDIKNPPTGGNPSPYGWSFRPMWRGRKGGGALRSNDEPTGYGYTADLPPTTTTTKTYGWDLHSNVGLGSDGLTSVGTWRKIRLGVGMNTVAAGGVGRADGQGEIWVDGLRRGRRDDVKWRLYEASNINRLTLATFRGGNSDGWKSATPGVVDIAGLEVVRVLSGKL